MILFQKLKKRRQCSPKVNIYANRLHAIKRYMDKLNLPGIPQEFLEIFFTASNNSEALMDELEGDKINIESTNRLLEILTNDMNELEEAAYRIVQNATLTEQLLQYSNRYRSFDDHVQAAFDESLYIFEREYDYALPSKVISDALEMVESWCNWSLCYFLWKNREQIRLIIEKWPLGGHFYLQIIIETWNLNPFFCIVREK